MQAGSIAIAVALIAAGFGIGWTATSAFLPVEVAIEPAPLPEPVREMPPTIIARSAPEPEPEREPEPEPEIARTEAKPKRRTPAPVIEQPKRPTILDACEASMRALKANPKSVDRFAEAYAAIKKASDSLPPDERRAVLAAINAANLTGDVEGLDRGLELLRARAR